MIHYKHLQFLLLIIGITVGASANAQENVTADSLLQKGLQLMQAGELSSSNEVLLSGLTLIPQEPDAKTEYLLKSNIGFNYALLNQFDPAIDYLKQSLLVEGVSFDSTLITIKTKSFYYLGSISRLKGDFRGALVFFDSTLVLSKNIFGEDHIRVGDVHNVMGLTYKYLGRYKEALSSYDLAFAIFAQAGNQVRQAMITHNVGEIHKERGFFDKAAKNMESALQHYIAGYGPEHIDVATIYVNLADLEFARGNYEQVLNYGFKAMAILNLTEEHRVRNLASLYSMFAQVYQQRGDLPEAVKYFDKAAAEYAKLSDEEVFALISVYNSKGEMYLNRMQLVEAQQTLERAKQLIGKYQQTDQTIYSGANLKLLAMTQAALGNHPEAYQLFEAAESTFTGLGIAKHPELLSIYLQWGLGYEMAGNGEKAMLFYQKGVNAGIRDFDSAGQNDKIDVTNVINSLSMLELLNAKARLLLETARASQEEATLQRALITLRSAGDLIDEARLSYRDHKDKLFLADLAYETYSLAVAACYDAYASTGDVNYVDQGFAFSERNKTFILQETTSNKNALRMARLPESIVEMESMLRVELSSLRQQYESALTASSDSALVVVRNEQTAAKSRYDSLLNTIEQQFPDYHQLKYSSQSISVTQVQQRVLASDEVLVEYFLSPDQLFIIAIEKENSKFIAIDITEDFGTAVDAFRESLVTRNKQQYLTVANQLYQYLVHPLGSIEAKKVYVVQDGVIGHVPFEILLKDDADAPFNELSYLIREHRFSYLYSASLSLARAAPSTAKGTFLGLAPLFSGSISAEALATRGEADELAPLPGAELEVETASRILDGRALLKAEATEGNFKTEAGGYRILHFATHAVVDNNNPELSRLFFTSSADSTNDGSLHVYELYNMDLNADLVTLSACNTGFGSVMNGEGVMSLGRGFAYAGSKNILMSLWLVSDKSTPMIMESFYKELAAGREKDVALHEAKLQYLAQSGPAAADPFFWGGFIFIGNTDTLDNQSDRTIWWISWTTFFALLVGGFVWRRRVT